MPLPCRVLGIFAFLQMFLSFVLGCDEIIRKHFDVFKHFFSALLGGSRAVFSGRLIFLTTEARYFLVFCPLKYEVSTVTLGNSAVPGPQGSPGSVPVSPCT